MRTAIRTGWVLSAVALLIVSCKKEYRHKTLPVVNTSAISAVTLNSAKGGGVVVDDGGAELITQGLVYSSTKNLPTVVDGVTMMDSQIGSFESLLKGLSSGTTYHVRAYASNAVGIGYGDVVDFETGNAAPEARDIIISGPNQVGGLLKAHYRYYDPEADVELSTTFQWYVATDALGAGETAIPGATDSTYIVPESQNGKYVRIGITVKAKTGTTLGAEVKSSFYDAIGDAGVSVTFMYNGQQVTYGIITSEKTGKKWLDRNLGAANVASSMTDYPHYGDLFQWGRLADGHQLMSRTGPNYANMKLVNSSIGLNIDGNFAYSSTDVPGHNHFIRVNIVASDYNDWRSPQNPMLWQGVNGINNPCPPGWRVPTIDEWTSEQLYDLSKGYEKLKLTLTGDVFGGTGDMQISNIAAYWSSSISTVDPTKSIVLLALESDNYIIIPFDSMRAEGCAVRCIK
jgi:hypothetical protein